MENYQILSKCYERVFVLERFLKNGIFEVEIMYRKSNNPREVDIITPINSSNIIMRKHDSVDWFL